MSDEAPSPPSDEEIRDELPADLDVTGLVGPYLFPNNSRRRIPGVLYLVIGAVCIGIYLWRRGDDPLFVNGGTLAAGIALVLFGLYHLQAGWDLTFDERDALVAATRAVGFPVGHASAQLGWRGLRSRPTWRILLYSNEPMPTKRGLVMVDGINGEVVAVFLEDNPEDWTDLSS
ncbi:MAG TPA: hypothetical protein VF183_13400 [Acidimicrobiales bacterium]